MLGHICSSDTHSKSDICFLECWRVVGSISSDCNNISHFFDTSDEQVLVFRSRPSQHTQVLVDLRKLFLVLDSFFDFLFWTLTWRIFIAVLTVESSYTFVELRPSHDGVFFLFGDDVTLFSNGKGSILVVSSNHSDSDACILTLLYSIWDFWTDNISDSEDANACQECFYDFTDTIFAIFVVGKASVFRLQVSVCTAYCSESSFGKAFDHVFDEMVLSGGVKFDSLALLVEIVCAVGQDVLSSTFDVESLVIAKLVIINFS
mmetsp:Transcript_9465/g.9191  ORF Transcript_9465/g.9191 Transcript_9465/m.9191 type:complete len:261 (-) Transcript_9465:2690-3472(-)